jgi:hypothetical protein
MGIFSKKPADKKERVQPQKKKIGRPRIWNTAEEMELAIEAYFEQYKPPTITGLALFLGYACRQSFYDAAKLDGFSDTIKRARARCEEYAENELFNNPRPTGAIFWLKNAGWSDRKDITINGNLTVKTITPEERKKRIDELERKRNAINDR